MRVIAHSVPMESEKIRLWRILPHVYMASVALLQFQLFAAEDITCNVLVNILSLVRFGIHLNYI